LLDILLFFMELCVIGVYNVVIFYALISIINLIKFKL